MALFLRKLLSVSFDESVFSLDLRGGNALAGHHLRSISKAFLVGYNAAISCNEPECLADALNIIVPTFRGFAFEGAAMAWSLVDSVSPGRAKLIPRLLRGEGWRHRYMIYIGAGWAFARLPQWFLPKPAQHDLLPWLIFDGYGFHQGCFRTHLICHFHKPQKPRLSGYAARVFNQGFGRSLWFICATNIDAIRETIKRFSPSDQADLWSGVALACTYAGGCSESIIERLRAVANPFKLQLAQGAAFAAKARLEANVMTRHTEIACKLLCDASAELAAHETDLALRGLAGKSADEPAFEMWRQKVQAAFAPRLEHTCFYSVG